MSSPQYPLTSSPCASSSALPDSPTTPSPSFRPRNMDTQRESSNAPLFESPTAPALRMNGVPSFRNVFATSTSPPTRHVVRSDPSLLTCFESSDRELYDLWAPKR